MIRSNQSEIKSIADLKYFKVVNIGHNETSITAILPIPPICVPLKDIMPPYCKTHTPDLVWCKAGDSCGSNDWMCSYLCQLKQCAHDGCCTGSWDWGGDSRKIFLQQEDVIDAFTNRGQ